MHYLADRIFYDNFNIYASLVFIAIGFIAGFFLRANTKGGKGKFKKMENEAKLNQARIAELKEKLDTLEKEIKSSQNPSGS